MARTPQLPKREEGVVHPWWWRRRVGFAPFYGGLASLVLSLVSLAFTDTQVLTVVLVAATVAALGANQKWGGKKKDRAMRWFVWSVIAACASFILAVHFHAIDARWIITITLGGICLFGAFWWGDEWNRKRVHLERDVTERWPILAKRIGIPHVRRMPTEFTDTGRRILLYWDKGMANLSQIMSRKPDLESILDIPEGRIRFEKVYDQPGMANPNKIYVTENTQSPILKNPVKFTEPTMRRFTDEMLISDREDGTKHTVVWYESDFGGMHTLVAGSTGSGKSGLYHLVLAESAYCPDLVRWGIDAKGGMALKPWASLFDWLIRDPETLQEDAVAMMRAIHDVLVTRSKYAADRGWSAWEPDSEHPILLIVVDEAAEVFGLGNFDIEALSGSIARMGRAAGVLLLIATQHPTNDALSSQQLMKNLRRRFCFAVEDQHAQRVIIPKSTELFDASEIPIGKQFVGTYYTSEGGQISRLSARVRYVTPEDVYRIVLKVGNDLAYAVPPLDPMSAKAAKAGSFDEERGESLYETRRIWTVEDAVPPKGWKVEDTAGDEMYHPELSGGERVEIEGSTPALPAGPKVGLNKIPEGHTAGQIPEDPEGHIEDDQGQIPGPDAHEPGALPPGQEGADMTDLSFEEMVEPVDEAERLALEKVIAEWYGRMDEGRMTPEQAQLALDMALDKAPPQGVSITELREVIPRSPSWMSDELRKRLQRDELKKVAQGRYVRTGRVLASIKAPADASRDAE